MKVYECPAALPPPEVDYRNYDRDREYARELSHRATLREWLVANGYNGKRTGEVVRFHVADGHAEYMLADGKKSCLIHLPYGDAYNYPDVRFLPKKEILRRIDAGKGLAALFARKA